MEMDFTTEQGVTMPAAFLSFSYLNVYLLNHRVKYLAKFGEVRRFEVLAKSSELLQSLVELFIHFRNDLLSRFTVWRQLLLQLVTIALQLADFLLHQRNQVLVNFN